MSQVAESNFPAGSDSPALLDDVQRAAASFIAMLRDGKGFSAPVTLASATTTDIGGQNSFAVEISGTTTITSFGTSYNGPRFLRFTGALTLTHNSTSLNLPGAANITTVAGDTAIAFPNLALNGWNVVNYTRANGASFPSGQLFGCTMSTAGSSTTMSISAGSAADSTNAVLMQLSAIAKTTSAWVVGTAAGGLDTGSIANSTWYHFYVIRRPDTGVVDVVFSTNATTPTLPANYTQYRRIGSGKTNGSAQWVKFVQRGDLFLIDVPTLDINSTAPGSTAQAGALDSVPLGVVVDAMLNIGILESAGSDLAYVSPFTVSDMAPSLSAPPGVSVKSHSSTAWGWSPITVTTDTNQEVRFRLATGGATSLFRAVTLGWIDTRGRNS